MNATATAAVAAIPRKQLDGVRMIWFRYCDNAGVIRGKAVHRRLLPDKLRSGLGLSVAAQAATVTDELLSLPGLGPVGEVRLLPDPATFRRLPYAPGHAAMASDLTTPDGRPWPLCPRDFLRRMAEQAAALGLSVRAAFEPEWCLARPDGAGGYSPLDESLDNSTIGAATARPVVDQVIDALLDQGLNVEQYYAELGPGQQEVTVAPTAPLAAADRQVSYRETVRAVAGRHGLLATFAPKPYPEQAGSGCHLHVSLWDAAGRRNRTYDAADPLGLSELGRQFVAGVLEHLPGLTALTCPSVNSYRRLTPGWWAGPWLCYGVDHREAALRLPSAYRGREESTTHLELRAGDSSANPYLALGGLLAAGLDGVARGLTPPPGLLTDVDPAGMPAAERAARGIRRLPETLEQATAELAGDPTLRAALGEPLADAFLSVRQAEAAYFAQRDETEEFAAHFNKY